MYPNRSVALRDMAVCETDIIGNEEYVKKYYPLSDQFLNQGRLTLISPKHILWAHKLMSVISKATETSKIVTLQDHCVKEARVLVCNLVSEEIFPDFQQQMMFIGIDKKETMMKLLDKVVEKAFNARVG
eukprot:CAMPEP_0198154806 /NCGR_PEP_ID=MMETSP1443-20131203/68802_1 /TAXON_ID=186043 /ORGANISM="Entomoneis sp., Strain CCMP2396" /LENGTH=128 /DNA_ID=CAMNT_0043821521 /DNA_START=1362 /DNA_END=1744 /DNA_ORIENTATION=-